MSRSVMVSLVYGYALNGAPFEEWRPGQPRRGPGWAYRNNGRPRHGVQFTSFGTGDDARLALCIEGAGCLVEPRSPEVVDPAALAVHPEWDATLRRVVRLWRLSDEIDARVHPDGRPRWLICLYDD